jgi:transaldolase
MATALEQLKKHTVIVSDTGDIESIKAFTPQDGTTNPSLVYQASQDPKYKHLVDDAVAYAKKKGGSLEKQVELAMDKLFVNFGIEILKIIPGRVSTEIDARLSFDTEATVRKGRELMALYKEAGVGTDRVLLKIATTWEGVQAAAQLEKEGLHVNMTLLFSLAQAQISAEAGVTLISPFVGRITDFFKAKEKVEGFEASKDPGVISVQQIYNYYKAHGYPTVVMGASFRNKNQCIELAGCDLLTISPQLLKELGETRDVAVEKKLDAAHAKARNHIPKVVHTENSFRWALNEDEMATVKTAEGIRNFAKDIVKLEGQIGALLK